MYYTVYKITNLINNKIYIGVHKTKDINDDYMGSGKILKRAQEKYGIENFKKEILEVFDNAEDMFDMESQLVNEDFVQNPETYNLKVGGEGGFDFINGNKDDSYYITRRNNGGKNKDCFKKHYDSLSNETYKQEHYLKTRKALKQKSLELYNDEFEIFRNFKGKNHTEETKKKIGEANSKHQSGTGNSQFGTMWIHSLEEKLSKKIKKDELKTYEDLGWIKGRKMKF